MHTWQAHRHRLLSGFFSGVRSWESGDWRSRSTSQHDDACAVSLSCDRVNVNNCQPVGRGPVGIYI